MPDRFSQTNAIKEEALRLGFDQVGIARAERLDEQAVKLKEWLDQGRHGKMDYMANHFEKRVDPHALVPGAKSIIVLSYNYYPERQPQEMPDFKIARYAYGRDYHKVIRKKLKHLLNYMRETFGVSEDRCFVDSAPVMERDWAAKSGVGWMGKNTLIIHPKKGSYFFLAEIITELELTPDPPIKDYCGTCTRCIEACPTDAIDLQGYTLDASKCISYLTIELKDEHLPETFKGQTEQWIFGCDICQEVCPWNRFSEVNQETQFQPSPELFEMSRADWATLTEEEFNDLFAGSAVKRTGYSGLKRNIHFNS